MKTYASTGHVQIEFCQFYNHSYTRTMKLTKKEIATLYST